MIETVLKTARLARLEVTEEEARRLAGEFERILAAFRVLEGLDLEGAPEVTRGGASEPRVRADEPRPSLAADRALANAPRREGDFYSVPKTVGPKTVGEDA